MQVWKVGSLVCLLQGQYKGGILIGTRGLISMWCILFGSISTVYKLPSSPQQKYFDLQCYGSISKSFCILECNTAIHAYLPNFTLNEMWNLREKWENYLIFLINNLKLKENKRLQQPKVFLTNFPSEYSSSPMNSICRMGACLVSFLVLW